MPLFSYKFSPKKAPPRKNIFCATKEGDSKAKQVDLEVCPIRLKLGGQECLFENGEWSTMGSGDVSGKLKETEHLKEYVGQLVNENNLLKLRAEVLLDMLTQTTVEAHLQEKELAKLHEEVNSLVGQQNKT